MITGAGGTGAVKYPRYTRTGIPQTERITIFLGNSDNKTNKGHHNQKLLNTNFVLRIDKVDVPCKSIQSMEQELEYESIQEGGMNDSVHIRRKAVSKPYTLQVERYVELGYKDLLPMGTVFENQLVVMVNSKPGTFPDSAAQFLFYGCMVTGKKYSEMDAEKPGIIVETTTIAYETMQVQWGSIR